MWFQLLFHNYAHATLANKICVWLARYVFTCALKQAKIMLITIFNDYFL